MSVTPSSPQDKGESPVKNTGRRRGPVSLFPKKVRIPVTVTLTNVHHRIVRDGMRRTGLSRSDFIGLSIAQHGRSVQVPLDSTAANASPEKFAPADDNR